MYVANIYQSKEWFEVLQTTKKSQTAVMTLAAGNESSGEPNVHDKSDQILLLIQGDVEAEVGSEKCLLKEGDVCVVPAGTRHRFKNTGPLPAITFNIYAPPEYAPDTEG